MQMAEAWGMEGISIATCLSTANSLINFPVASRKLFYMYDLEWLRGNQRSYDALYNIYQNKDFDFIARSETHAKLIENCLNRKPIGIIPQLDIMSIKQCLAKKN
jgi:hypothetical protein